MKYVTLSYIAGLIVSASIGFYFWKMITTHAENIMFLIGAGMVIGAVIFWSIMYTSGKALDRINEKVVKNAEHA